MIRLTEHFSDVEFQCRCRLPGCNAAPMDPDFMRLLEALRVKADVQFPITSGARCHYWNAHPDVGGAPNSQHRYLAAEPRRGFDRRRLCRGTGLRRYRHWVFSPTTRRHGTRRAALGLSD